MACGAVVLFVFGTAVWAQQKQPLQDSSDWHTGKYIQQHLIDVNDVPGHKVRIQELQRIYNDKSQLVISGVRVKEAWFRGYSDYTNGKGRAWGYGQWILEDGGKVFTEYSGISASDPRPNGSVKGTFHGVSRLVGGTGKYSKIRGTTVDSNDFDTDPQSGYNKAESKGEYWFED